MHKTCSFLVLLFHGCVSFFADGAYTKQDDVILFEDMCKLWTLVLGFIFAGDFWCMHVCVKENRFNYHVFSICFSVIANAVVLYFTCPVVGFCFFLHAIASVCINVATDFYSAPFSRVCAGFVLFFTFFCIFFNPKPLEMTSKVYFVDYKSKAYYDLSFEAAHLCAVFVCILVDILATIMDFFFS